MPFFRSEEPTGAENDGTQPITKTMNVRNTAVSRLDTTRLANRRKVARDSRGPPGSQGVK